MDRNLRVWEDAIEKAVKNGLDLAKWSEANDQKEFERVLEDQKFLKISFKEAFVARLTPMKMKALAFSHEFAEKFFPKEFCDDSDCPVCAGDKKVGHDCFIRHMKTMCDYADFTYYLEIVMDEEA
jgi:hypothetical protein